MISESPSSSKATLRVLGRSHAFYYLVTIELDLACSLDRLDSIVMRSLEFIESEEGGMGARPWAPVAADGTRPPHVDAGLVRIKTSGQGHA